MFTMRFDLRSPAGAAPTAELYAAAIEMSAWAEGRGCAAAVLCEHHASEDGYLPSPLIMASAIAARTESLALMLAAVLLPLYDPVRLAEEMIVLDIISRGRVTYVLGLGYRPEEYEHFGLDVSQRGRMADEKLAALVQLVRGEDASYQGRRIRVTPPPYTANGPTLMWGGGSLAAARRAGRYGLGLLAQANPPGMHEAYVSACRDNGHEPGVTLLPDRDTASAVFVADDVDKAWDELGSYLLHDALTYGKWNPGNEHSAGVSHAKSVDELRASSTTYRVFSVDDAVDFVEQGNILNLTPLCGGIPPAAAWPYLERVANAVMPRLGHPVRP